MVTCWVIVLPPWTILPGEEVLEHGAGNAPVVDPLMLKEFRILCSDESLDQRLGNLLIGNGDPVVHQEFAHDLIFFGVDDGVSIKVSFLQRL